MKRIILQPVLSDDNIIVQYTDNIVADKATVVTVPDGFQGIAIIEEKDSFRIEPCVEKPLLSYGREFKGKHCRVVFVRKKAIPAMAWGFGNIQVNNTRLKEAYRVGANGKYIVEIANIAKLVAYFGSDKNITAEKLRECTISVIKNIGTAYLAEYFAGTDISVFEISSHTAELREKLFDSLCGEDAFVSLGLKLKDLTVASIYINEDDIELIRSRINQAADVPSAKDDRSFQDEERGDILARLEEELSNIRAEISAKQATPGPDIAQRLKDLRDELALDISSQIGEKMQDMQDSIAESIEEKFLELMPLRDKAEKDYLKHLKITAEVCIERAIDEDDLVPAAAIIYTNVEENLINNFNVRHENGNFVMSYKDYLDKAEKLSAASGEFLLKRYDRKTRSYVLLPPSVLKSDKDGTPELVEMPPVIRFISAGLNVSDAVQAKDYWRFLNKIRHKAPENSEYLKNEFANFAQERGYIVSALEFFRKHGLYTKG